MEEPDHVMSSSISSAELAQEVTEELATSEIVEEQIAPDSIIVTAVQDLGATTSNLVGAIGSAEEVSNIQVTLLDLQNVIKEFGSAVERFDFTKASQIMDDYRKNNLSNPMTAQERAIETLLCALSEIAACDSKYYTLSFLVPKPKSMFRRDTGGLINQYRDIELQLCRGIEEAGERTTVAAHLLEQCKRYVITRGKMINLFHSMTTLDTTVCIKWNSLNNLTTIIRDNLIDCHHPDISPLAHMCQEEVDILLLLFAAQKEISECKMFESLLRLKEVRERLKFWAKEIAVPDGKSFGFFSRFMSNSEQLPRNRLIFWLGKFYDLLMAKFSLYFTNDLETYCSEEDIHSIHSIDNKYNFINSFREFLRSSKALLVAIVMDRSEELETEKFHGFGYHRLEHLFRPGEPEKPQSGLNARCPYVFKEQILPQPEAPRLSVMLPSELYHEDISTFVEELSNGRLAKCEERNIYRLPRWINNKDARAVVGEHLENKLYMVAVYPSIMADMENPISSFMRNMHHILRGCALFAELKSKTLLKT